MERIRINKMTPPFQCTSERVISFQRVFCNGSILQNLVHEVTCTICQEAFCIPKTLPGLHTFCCECLNKHLRYRRRENLPINCPICSAEIQAPDGDNFDHLPTSFYHNRLLETLSIKQCNAGSDVTCGNCKKFQSE